jgi:hypothetical protein
LPRQFDALWAENGRLGGNKDKPAKPCRSNVSCSERFRLADIEGH